MGGDLFSDTSVNCFAVSGTRNGEVYIWPMPTEKETARLPGTLKYIDQTSAPATKQIRVWAEFDNPRELDLKVGTNVTIIIEPPAK